MRVLAADKWFASVFFQEFLDSFYRRIHLAFHITGIVVSSVVADTFIMYQAEKSKRLQILNKSNDGFYIAQEDLKLRGPGDLFGVRQSGDLNFEIADIFRDASILKKASDAAGYILSLDGTLELPQHRLLKEKLEEYAGRQIEDPGL